MNKLFTLLALSVFSLCVHAQSSSVKEDQPYGKIDTADLIMKSCDFEKDANAEVLFDKADITFDAYGIITYIRHKRIKIFNDKGKDEANITIPYIDRITDIAAETINLNGKTIEYNVIDPTLIYKQKVDAEEKAVVFTFPNVKPGSVIEMQYKWKIRSDIVPVWYFQSSIPTRFSEIDVSFYSQSLINLSVKVNQPFYKNADTLTGRGFYNGQKHIRALSNIRSYKLEPFMTPEYDNLQKLSFKSYMSIWARVAGKLLNDNDFGKQLDNKLTGEKEILDKIDSIKNNDVKIDSIFNMVKGRMVWDKKNRWFTQDGIQKAWKKKTGNSTEINLILYHLLTQASIKAYPLEVSTTDYGVVDPYDASLSQFNKTVVCIPVDSIKYFILDASDKHNTYDQVPFELLSTYGLFVNPKNGRYSLFQIQSDTPAKQLVFINASILPTGKMTGTADINSDSYDKANSIKLYNDLGEKKYIAFLADNDNDLKISSLKIDNIKNDTLPLAQHIDFELNLTASDENYIYFNPNLFTSFGTNPFLSENRYSNIDFVFSNNFIISGVYKIPAGYKVDVLPKSQLIMMEDKGISFKRIVGEQNGAVEVRYIISRKRTSYNKEEYPGLYKFYKKMFEMLNEQIVLKKT